MKFPRMTCLITSIAFPSQKQISALVLRELVEPSQQEYKVVPGLRNQKALLQLTKYMRVNNSLFKDSTTIVPKKKKKEKKIDCPGSTHDSDSHQTWCKNCSTITLHTKKAKTQRVAVNPTTASISHFSSKQSKREISYKIKTRKPNKTQI